MGHKARKKAQRRARELTRDAPPPAYAPPSRIAASDAGHRLRIGSSALAAAHTRAGHTLRPAFQVARPAPGVVPDGVAALAMDDALSSLHAYAATSDYGEGMQWLGYPYLAELSQRPEYRRISETIAKEMTRKWIKVMSVGDDDKTAKVAAVEASLKKYRVQTMFRRAVEIDGFFGRAQLYIDTGHTDNPDELATPLTRHPNKITRRMFKRLALIEPIWSYPNDYNAADPLHRDFYRPRSWYIQARKVHSSRLLTFVAREVPDLLKPAYAFGGLSLSQMARPYIENWLRTRQSVSDLIHSFSVSGIKTNMLSTLSDVGEDQLQKRALLFNATRDNRGLMMLDKDTEEFFNVAAPLGTLDKLQAQSQEQMASVSGIPLIVLLGITPSGLNASSEGELKTFYAWIEAQQEQFFTDPLTKVIDIIQLSEFGEIDPDITFRYEPLWALDEAAQATVRKTDADADVALINAGVLAPIDSRKRLAAAEDSPYAGLDVDDLPEPPGGGDPAMEGDPSQAGDPDQPGAAPPPNENKPAPGESKPPDAQQEQSAFKSQAGDSALRDNDGRYWRGHDRKTPRPRRRPVPKTGADEFKEGDHPRGQPGNAGQFGPGGGGGGAAEPKVEVKAKGKTKSPTVPVTGPTKSPTVPVTGPTKSQTAPGQTKSPTEKTTRWTGLTPTKIEGKVRTNLDGSPLPAHVLAMKIPPGYTQVAYNPDPNAGLVAMAKDDKGRKVRDVPYYKPEVMAENADAKFDRVAALSSIIDKAVAFNEAAKRDPKTAALADCCDLVMKMGVRPGSTKDTGAKAQAYGATTLQGRHVVQDADGKVRLQFVGKEGQNLNLAVDDPALAKSLVARSRSVGPDEPIFPGVSETKLLAHVKAATGSDEYKSKDFRTLLGTRTAASLVAQLPPPADQKAYQKAVMQVATQVSQKLGNKPLMALKAYISPVTFAPWQIAA